MTISSRYPDSLPSINLNFAKLKRLDPRITFTRASNATYIDGNGVLRTAASNVPRFEHNSTTGRCLGLLVEGMRTNLLLRSEEFDNASWTVFDGKKTVTPNTVTAPDGTLTADTIIADGTLGAHFVDQSVTLTAQAYSLSVFAKAGTNSFIQIRTSTALGARSVNYDLTSGTVGTSSGSITSSSIQPIGSGWYRCSITFTPNAATGTIAVLLVTSGSAVSAESNTLTTSVHIWGAQLESGAFPTSYIPTGASTATRAADIATITGANFSSWYRQDEGTVFSVWQVPTSTSIGGAKIYQVSNSNGTNIIWGRLQAGINRIFDVTSSSVSQATFNLGTITAGQRYNSAISFAANSFGFAENGVASLTVTSGSVPSVDRVGIGCEPVSSSGHLNGTISRFTFWPRRLPDSILQELTR